jgi:N-acyl-L-homoserine lactone synthetase
MSNIDRGVPNEAVIPIFETDLFAGNEEARFAVGILAVGDEIVVGREAEFTAYTQLRGKVYAHQTRMIPTDVLNHDDSETDHDDARSVHFGIFEQVTPDEENRALRARSVGAIRLIIKSAEDDRPLPVEDFFPEAFEGNPAPLGSTEASRLIARHESAVVQGAIKWTSYAAAEAYILNHNLGPTYATVEPGLEKDFARSRMPFNRIADPKYVPEYAADNLGLEIDTTGFAEIVKRVKPGLLEGLTEHEGNFFYYGRQLPAIAAAPRSVAMPASAVA